MSGETFESDVVVSGSQPWLRGLFVIVVLLLLFPLFSSSVKQRSLHSLVSRCLEFQGFSHLSDAFRAIGRSPSQQDL